MKVCRARSGSTGFRRRFWRRFRGGFCGEPGQVQQGSGEGSSSGEGFGEGSRKPWCKAKSGSTGSVEGSGEGMGGFGAEVFGEGSGEGLGGFGAEPG